MSVRAGRSPYGHSSVKLYRVLERLECRPPILKGHIGTLLKLKELSRQKLEERGRIAIVHAPPLEMLPGWRYRARHLRRKTGVNNAEDLLMADADDLSQRLMLSPSIVRRWQDEIRNWLTVAHKG